MSGHVTIFTRAKVPEHLAKAWLQHLRDFDMENSGCQFEVMADAPALSMEELIELVRLDPPLGFTDIFERKRR